jgi:hypothetical protein
MDEKEFAPGVALKAPPQALTLRFMGLARIIPSDIASVKAMPVSATEPGLCISMINLEVEPQRGFRNDKTNR